MKPPYYSHGGEIRDASGSPVIMASELDALNAAWEAGFEKGRKRQEPQEPQAAEFLPSLQEALDSFVALPDVKLPQISGFLLGFHTAWKGLCGDPCVVPDDMHKTALKAMLALNAPEEKGQTP